MAEGTVSGDKDTNLAKPAELTQITLNDGKEYELAPVNVNILAEIEDEFDQPFHKVLGDGRIKPIRYMLWLRLKDKYPEIKSEEKLGTMIDMNTIYNLGELLGVK